MARINTEKWKPSPDNPNRKVYDGQRTARAVAGLFVMIHDDRWTKLETVLQRYHCRAEWDALEPDIGEFDRAWSLLIEN